MQTVLQLLVMTDSQRQDLQRATSQINTIQQIILIHLPGVVNPADMLTKALGWVLHHCYAPHLMGHYGNPCQ